MKKLFLIGVGFALAVTIFGVAGFAYAQVQEPPEDPVTEGAEFPYGRAEWGRGTRGGKMERGGDFVPGGMMGFGLAESETGPLHDYLWAAIADAFGLTEEQIEAFEIARETVQGIRADLSQDEIRDAMQQAITTAIQDALEDGAITEAQAEQWLERLDQLQGFPGTSLGRRAQPGSFRQGFVKGLNIGRQMVLNYEYLDAALAQVLDISVEELAEMRAEGGFNLKDYAEEMGLSHEETMVLHAEIFTNAVNAALEDGAITQEQADWLLQRLENLK
jgi:hypothetical protein